MILLPLAFILAVGLLGYLAHRGSLPHIAAWMDRHQMLRCDRTFFELHGRRGGWHQCEKPRLHAGRHGRWHGERIAVKQTPGSQT